MSASAAGAVRMWGVQGETRASIGRQVRRGLRPLRAEKPQRLSDWAERKFYLSPEGSHQQGQWHAYPFQLAILDWMGDDGIEEIAVKKAKRVGYTKMLLALIAYTAAHRRRKQALWQPTDDDRDSFVKTEVEPMLRDVRALRPVRLTQTTEDTLKLKAFVGSVLHLLGGKAARAYRRITVALALLDELDGFDQQIEKSSDPVTLARGRLEGAPFPKLVCGSTPRIKGLSHTDHRYQQAAAQMACNITCPHCGVDHPLTWGGKKVAHGFKWDEGRPETVRHVCPHCHGAITQAQYLQHWGAWTWSDAKGRYSYGCDRMWRDARGQPCEPPRSVGVHIWAAYSPQRTWESIVREFLEAHAKLKQGDQGPMQGFVNETLGDVFEIVYERTDEHALEKRAERYDLRVVPRGGVVLTAGVDVQGNRWEVVVYAWGRDDECWVVDYAVLDGNPAKDEEWDEKVKAYLEQPLWHVDGAQMYIDAAAIDTGGHFTHQSYSFVRRHARRRWFAVAGSPVDGCPIKGRSSLVDVNHRGKVAKKGVRRWMVGTDTAKDLLHGRLQLERAGPGWVHFSDQLPAGFYRGLTIEQRVPVRTARGIVYRWVNPPGGRNEPLDCTVYAMFAAEALGIKGYAAAQWERLERALLPDLFDAVRADEAAVVPAAEEAPRPPPAAVPSRAKAPAPAGGDLFQPIAWG